MSNKISAADVKKLRDQTGAGMMDAKKALAETDGDVEKAIEALRKKGLAKADKKSGRETGQGIIDSYIHGEGRIGVLLEVNCETDFVARNKEFKEFVHDLALHIAASNPLYVSREDVPEDVVEKEREIYLEQSRAEGKDGKVLDRIVEGKLEKYFSEVCLLEQPFVKDQDVAVEELLKQKIAQLGENINIGRFSRFELGQD